MSERVSEGLVRGFLHRPKQKELGGVVLAHGAGSDSQSKLMVALASAFAEAGLAALRIDLPFRHDGRSGPPNPSRSVADRDGLREAAVFMKQFAAPVYMAGHSYGGRQATMLAAEHSDTCSALLLFSYPLHPPGKPEQPRTSHFAQLQTPSLFVHGDRDPFGSPEEMQSALQLIPAKPRLHIVERAAHELKPVIKTPAVFVEMFLRDYVAGKSAT